MGSESTRAAIWHALQLHAAELLRTTYAQPLLGPGAFRVAVTVDAVVNAEPVADVFAGELRVDVGPGDREIDLVGLVAICLSQLGAEGSGPVLDAVPAAIAATGQLPAIDNAWVTVARGLVAKARAAYPRRVHFVPTRVA